MAKNNYDLQAMKETLERINPKTTAGVIRSLLPLINQKRREGVTLQQIYDALVENGLRSSRNNFVNAVVRLTKEAKLQQYMQYETAEPNSRMREF